MGPKLIALLSHRRLPLIAAALAALLVLPALGLGIVLDDYLQRAILLKMAPYTDGRTALLTLFDFTDAYPGETQNGLQPWYRSPNLRLGFFRPLSSATHVLDYLLWPDNFPLQHLHSILWYVATALLVGLLYRRIGGGAAVAGIAMVMFAVEDSHSMPAGWLANRNSLVAMVFALAAVILHLQWRRKRSWPALAGALAALAAGLLGGESAIAAIAYIVAYQLFIDQGPITRRMLALTPYLALIVVWRVIYLKLGFGIVGCGVYIDPASAPLHFLTLLPERMTLLMVSQWLQVQTEPLIFATIPVRAVVGALAGMICLLLAWLFWPLLRRDPTARFWAAAMVMCLVPISAAFVMDRNLIYAGVGAFGLLALMARETGLLGGAPTITGWRRTATAALVFLHLWVALVLLPLRVISIQQVFGSVENLTLFFPGGPSVTGQTVFWVNGNDFFTCYSPLINQVKGRPAPKANFQLGFIGGGVTVRRTGERSLLLRQDLGFLPTMIDMLMWTPEWKFRVGQRIDKRAFVAEVKEVLPDGRPAVMEFTFARPLESPDYIFLCIDGRIETCRMPAVGQELRLAGFTLDFLQQLRGQKR